MSDLALIKQKILKLDSVFEIINQKNQQLQDEKESYRKLVAEYTEQCSRVERLQTDLVTYKRLFEENSNMYVEAKKEVDKLQPDLKKLRAEHGNCQVQLKQYKQKEASLTKKVAEEKLKCNGLRQEVANAKKDLKVCIADCKLKVQTVQARQNKLEEENKELSDAIEKLCARKPDVEKETSDVGLQCSEVKSVQNVGVQCEVHSDEMELQEKCKISESRTDCKDFDMNSAECLGFSQKEIQSDIEKFYNFKLNADLIDEDEVFCILRDVTHYPEALEPINSRENSPTPKIQSPKKSFASIQVQTTRTTVTCASQTVINSSHRKTQTVSSGHHAETQTLHEQNDAVTQTGFKLITSGTQTMTNSDLCTDTAEIELNNFNGCNGIKESDFNHTKCDNNFTNNINNIKDKISNIDVTENEYNLMNNTTDNSCGDNLLHQIIEASKGVQKRRRTINTSKSTRKVMKCSVEVQTDMIIPKPVLRRRSSSKMSPSPKITIKKAIAVLKRSKIDITLKGGRLIKYNKQIALRTKEQIQRRMEKNIIDKVISYFNENMGSKLSRSSLQKFNNSESSTCQSDTDSCLERYPRLKRLRNEFDSGYTSDHDSLEITKSPACEQFSRTLKVDKQTVVNHGLSTAADITNDCGMKSGDQINICVQTSDDGESAIKKSKVLEGEGSPNRSKELISLSPKQEAELIMDTLVRSKEDSVLKGRNVKNLGEIEDNVKDMRDSAKVEDDVKNMRDSEKVQDDVKDLRNSEKVKDEVKNIRDLGNVEDDVKDMRDSERVEDDVKNMQDLERVEDDVKNMRDLAKVEDDVMDIRDSEKVQDDVKDLRNSEKVEDDVKNMKDSEKVEDDVKNIRDLGNVEDDVKDMKDSERVEEDLKNMRDLEKVEDDLKDMRDLERVQDDVKDLRNSEKVKDEVKNMKDSEKVQDDVKNIRDLGNVEDDVKNMQVSMKSKSLIDLDADVASILKEMITMPLLLSPVNNSIYDKNCVGNNKAKEGGRKRKSSSPERRVFKQHAPDQSSNKMPEDKVCPLCRTTINSDEGCCSICVLKNNTLSTDDMINVGNQESMMELLDSVENFCKDDEIKGNCSVDNTNSHAIVERYSKEENITLSSTDQSNEINVKLETIEDLNISSDDKQCEKFQLTDFSVITKKSPLACKAEITTIEDNLVKSIPTCATGCIKAIIEEKPIVEPMQSIKEEPPHSLSTNTSDISINNDVIVKSSEVHTNLQIVKKEKGKKCAKKKKSREPWDAIKKSFKNAVRFKGVEEYTVAALTIFKTIDTGKLLSYLLHEVVEDECEVMKGLSPFEPFLSITQKTVLGLLLHLEKSHDPAIVESFLTTCEHRLLFKEKDPLAVEHIIRLYASICKMRNLKSRLRRLIFDGLYFMGDLVLPLIYYTLTSWIQVLQRINAESEIYDPFIKILVQVVHTKSTNVPEHNLSNLKNLLQVYYRYPKERYNENDLFKEFLEKYICSQSSKYAFAILILCKNHDLQWVIRQLALIDELILIVKDKGIVEDLTKLKGNIQRQIGIKKLQ